MHQLSHKVTGANQIEKPRFELPKEGVGGGGGELYLCSTWRFKGKTAEIPTKRHFAEWGGGTE